jgi:hypothetical protein
MIVDLPAYQLIHLIVCGKKPCEKTCWEKNIGDMLGKILPLAFLTESRSAGAL